MTKSDAVEVKATGQVGVVIEVISAKRVLVSFEDRTTYVMYKSSLNVI